MTTQKDFKRLVRGRMQKTGESYTAARASLLTQGARRNGAAAETNGHRALSPALSATREVVPSANGAAQSKPQTVDFAKLAGMADEKVKAATGCTWERWVWALDQVDAHKWPHREIAQYVHEKFKVPSWWTQTVTVGYERIKGLREIGQRRTGAWGASKSKTIAAGASTVFKAFKQPKLRTAWLPNKVAIRAAVPNKSLRLTWEDGTSVEVYLVSKARSKTQVAIEHTKISSREASDRMKAFWSDRLDDLAARLEAGKK
jgi:hypothetical protein